MKIYKQTYANGQEKEFKMIQDGYVVDSFKNSRGEMVTKFGKINQDGSISFNKYDPFTSEDIDDLEEMREMLDDEGFNDLSEVLINEYLKKI